LIRDHFDGELPLAITALCQLPGIGRSTAGAILALAVNQRHPILDGNVKRVLARFHAVAGWPGRAEVLASLWKLAEQHTPSQRVADYTQAMMDLGALICIRGRPRCSLCPLQDDCAAHAQGCETQFPTPRPRRNLPLRKTCMLMLRTLQGEVLLEKRPPTGVWGGLWSFPECSPDSDAEAWCRDILGLIVIDIQAWAVLRHTFSHFHLEIIPLRITVNNRTHGVMEGERYVWYNTRQLDGRGFAAPVKRLLSLLATDC
jgi:A/G-specific adenine glycosylase